MLIIHFSWHSRIGSSWRSRMWNSRRLGCTTVRPQQILRYSQKHQLMSRCMFIVSIAAFEIEISVLNKQISTIHSVSVPQNAPPQIRFLKDQFYVGENLIANCSTSKARPAPHITWLINGKKVNFNCHKGYYIYNRNIPSFIYTGRWYVHQNTPSAFIIVS